MPSRMLQMPFDDSEQIFSYEARLHIDEHVEKLLNAFGNLSGHIERRLFVDLQLNKNINELKSLYLKDFQITARHFNAIHVQVGGKIASIKEKRKVDIKELEEKINGLNKTIEKLKKRSSHAYKAHQKSRRLGFLKEKLANLKSDHEKGIVRLCFGSKRLFRAQFNLDSAGYSNHEEWQEEWRFVRSNHFFLLGSKEESHGNQSCTATVSEEEDISLRIRLPDAFLPLNENNKYLVLSGIRFKYGHKDIIESIKACEERKRLKQAGSEQYKEAGVAISFRFKRDSKSWRVFVSCPKKKPLCTTSSNKGVIGVDINANHLAICETDRFGNPIEKISLPLNTYGKDPSQSKALIGNACALLINQAKEKGKSIVIEELEFLKKRANLRENGDARYSRMLSSFAYSFIIQSIKFKAWKEGVSVAKINPAFTSVIGRIKFSRRYGLTIHQAAALSIGRRHLGVSEKVPRHLEAIPDGKGDHVALSLPVRNRDKHVWSQWGVIKKRLLVALAAHARARKSRSSSAKPTLEIGPSQALPVESWHANPSELLFV